MLVRWKDVDDSDEWRKVRGSSFQVVTVGAAKNPNPEDLWWQKVLVETSGVDRIRESVDEPAERSGWDVGTRAFRERYVEAVEWESQTGPWVNVQHPPSKNPVGVPCSGQHA